MWYLILTVIGLAFICSYIEHYDSEFSTFEDGSVNMMEFVKLLSIALGTSKNPLKQIGLFDSNENI